MEDKEIVDKILDGASLRTFMVPDDSIPTNHPEHIETYDLPHIVINGGSFWAKSENAHLIHWSGDERVGIISFCYTNIGNLFCSYNSMNNEAVFMSKSRYKEHVWLIKENYKLIWDSDNEELSNDIIKKEIEHGAKFKIALLDQEDIWNIHPVDLPMYYSGEDKFEIKTVVHNYPEFFRHPTLVKNLYKQNIVFFKSKPINNKTGCLPIEARNFSSFYVIRSNGSYYGIPDIPKRGSHQYKRLKLFVDNI